jgi:HTH-type transcriptional regulator/antitoxin HigA
MKLHLLKNQIDYETALDRIEELWDAKEGTDEFSELELLGVLIEKYEEQHHKIDAPTPIAAIRFRMEQEGLLQKDLIPAFGDKATVSRVLKGTRNLTLENVRELHRLFKIPLESLVGIKINAS